MTLTTKEHYAHHTCYSPSQGSCPLSPALLDDVAVVVRLCPGVTVVLLLLVVVLLLVVAVLLLVAVVLLLALVLLLLVVTVGAPLPVDGTSASPMALYSTPSNSV